VANKAAYSTPSAFSLTFFSSYLEENLSGRLAMECFSQTSFPSQLREGKGELLLFFGGGRADIISSICVWGEWR